MVSTTEITIIICVVTLVLSVATSMFISGSRWGRVEQSLKDLESDRVRSADITGLRDRLSRIEGMFTLRLKDGDLWSTFLPPINLTLDKPRKRPGYPNRL